MYVMGVSPFRFLSPFAWTSHAPHFLGYWRGVRGSSCRISESQARQRVEEEARALQIAMLHAKRRESEGLDMMPHPGNHLRQGSREKAVFSSGMAVAYGALAEPGQYDRYSTAGAQGKDVGNAGALGATVESQGPSAYGSSTGGYQTREYETSSYQVSEYKSVYDT